MWIFWTCIVIMAIGYIIGWIHSVNKYRGAKYMPYKWIQIPFEAYIRMCIFSGPIAIVVYFLLVAIFY